MDALGVLVCRVWACFHHRCAPSPATGLSPAGKSSFINWYVGEELQTTGVAVETQGPGRTVCNFL